jgi:ribonuclease-3
MLNKSQEKLQEVIGYKFNNLEVLCVALTHKSYSIETDGKSYNKRMEFLGDSILSAVVAETLYLRYPYESEGKLSQLKAHIVSNSNISSWAREINLGSYVLLGKAEDTERTRQKKNLLCDVFEAIVGAIYLDSGFKNTKKFILKFLNNQKEVIITDYKSRFQEAVQSVYKELPEYRVIKELGPDHDKKFEVAVYVKNKLFGKGIGNSKKEAHHFAAKQAMKNINKSADINSV